VGAAVFSSIVNFGFALCVGGHFHSWRLVFRVVRHSALLVLLHFHVVHDVCVGFAWFDGRIVFVLVFVFLARACYPAVRLRAWKTFVMFIFELLLCLCAGQASSAAKVLYQCLHLSCCQGCHSASAIDADSMPQCGRSNSSNNLLRGLGTRRWLW
jgi:hypothetical protein